jgi:hypothetical protein
LNDDPLAACGAMTAIRKRAGEILGEEFFERPHFWDAHPGAWDAVEAGIKRLKIARDSSCKWNRGEKRRSRLSPSINSTQLLYPHMSF